MIKNVSFAPVSMETVAQNVLQILHPSLEIVLATLVSTMNQTHILVNRVILLVANAMIPTISHVPNVILITSCKSAWMPALVGVQQDTQQTPGRIVVVLHKI
jgi:hypothetical protein